MKEYIKILLQNQDLTTIQAQEAMNIIMEGKATDAQIGSFLTAMRMKGETIDEITACAKVMRSKSKRIYTTGDVMDLVGTGGDGANTFNVSTLSSLVVAAAGIKVAKHGNRSVSSKCGSADLLEALGVKLEVEISKNQQILEEIGICFMFAPLYHTSMRYVARARKELGVRTIFNILGPLTSPAQVNLQLLGVYDEKLVEPMAKVLSNLGVKHAMVVCGHDGLDEVSLTTSTTVCEVQEGSVNSFFISPKNFGFEACKIEDLVGDTAEVNKKIALNILQGKKGHQRNMVVINSALALYTGLNHLTLKQCVKRAEEVLDSGLALAKLKQFVEISHTL